MTSSTVNLRGVVGNGSLTFPTPKVQETGGGTDFSQVLENATCKDSVPDSGVQTQTTKDKHQVEKEVPAEDVSEPTQTDDSTENDTVKGVTESQKPENVDVPEEDLEEAMEVIGTVILEIQQLFCDTLGISKEELMQALETLGMTEMDMLAAGSASKLVLYLEGKNEMALLTDENLYNTVQSLERELQQISEHLIKDLEEVSPEDAGQLLDKALEAMKGAEASKEAPVINITETTEAPEVVAHQGVSEGERSSKEGKGEEQKSDSNLMAGNQVFNADFHKNIVEVQNADTVFDMEQTRMIMDQIMEYMDIQLDAEESTLQMQLHPETLGTLQITISAKEGVMTAQFTAESEAVKAVLENQIVQLQDKFEQQNIKVEAIEIAVATHGFEQNLQQDDNSGSYQEEQKKARVRKLDLDSLEAIDELPEEDRVVADMMQLHGNRLDFMA